MVIENAFIILENQFHRLLALQQTPDIVKGFVLAMVCLHNLIRIRYPGVQNAMVTKRQMTISLFPMLRETIRSCRRWTKSLEPAWRQ